MRTHGPKVIIGCEWKKKQKQKREQQTEFAMLENSPSFWLSSFISEKTE